MSYFYVNVQTWVGGIAKNIGQFILLAKSERKVEELIANLCTDINYSISIKCLGKGD